MDGKNFKVKRQVDRDGWTILNDEWCVIGHDARHGVRLWLGPPGDQWAARLHPDLAEAFARALLDHVARFRRGEK